MMDKHVIFWNTMNFLIQHKNDKYKVIRKRSFKYKVSI